MMASEDSEYPYNLCDYIQVKKKDHNLLGIARYYMLYVCRNYATYPCKIFFLIFTLRIVIV